MQQYPAALELFINQRFQARRKSNTSSSDVQLDIKIHTASKQVSVYYESVESLSILVTYPK
jgi:hypothetical protein